MSTSLSTADSSIGVPEATAENDKTGAGEVAAAATDVASTVNAVPLQPLSEESACIDISDLKPGELKEVRVGTRPVYVLHRTPEQIAGLAGHEHLLVDPHSQEPRQPEAMCNRHRSLRPEILVVDAVCTHRPCMVDCTAADDRTIKNYFPEWPGGFYCPCHGALFDFAGRVFTETIATINLRVPPYEFESESVIRIKRLG